MSRPIDLEHLLIGGGEVDERTLDGVLRAVLVDNVDAILVVDDMGIIRAANPAAGTMFGRDVAELIGGLFGHAVETGAREELEILAPGATQYAEMVVGSTTWEGREAKVVTLRNVTARRRAVDALHDYVSMTAHEVATPLTSISGFAETLLTSWDELPDARRLEFVGIIGRHAERISRISKDLLALSRIDAESMEMHPEHVEVLPLVRELLEDDPIGIEVEVDVAADLAVHADPMHMLTILGNFVTNAEKYGEPPFVIRATGSEGFVEISVIDHGDGVPREFVPHLFERFARARRRSVGTRREGTGLGLALSVGLAEINGGTVSHRQVRPHGSAFSLVLPRSSADDAHA